MQIVFQLPTAWKEWHVIQLGVWGSVSTSLEFPRSVGAQILEVVF
jgi:hypothetical protein